MQSADHKNHCIRIPFTCKASQKRTPSLWPGVLNLSLCEQLAAYLPPVSKVIPLPLYHSGVA
jgi:hypothetical protein